MEDVGVMLPDVGIEVTMPPTHLGDFPHGLRVLLLDAEAPARHELEAQLQACGYLVSPCCSAADATTALRGAVQAPQLLLADTAKLVSAGSDAAALLGAAAVAGVPLLLMCSSATADDLTLGERLGCVGFLERPLSPLDVAQIWQYAAQPDVTPPAFSMSASGAELDDDGGLGTAPMADELDDALLRSPHHMYGDAAASPACLPFDFDMPLAHHVDVKPGMLPATPGGTALPHADAKVHFGTDLPQTSRFVGDSRNHSQTNTPGCSGSMQSCSMAIKVEADDVDLLSRRRHEANNHHNAAGVGDGDDHSSLLSAPPAGDGAASAQGSWHQHRSAAGVHADGMFGDAFAALCPPPDAPALGLSAGQLPPLPAGVVGIVWGLPTNPLMFGMPTPPMPPPMMAMPPMMAPWGPACVMPVGVRGPPCGPMHYPHSARMHPYMIPGRAFGMGPMAPMPLGSGTSGGTVSGDGRAAAGGAAAPSRAGGPAAAAAAAIGDGGAAAAAAPGVTTTTSSAGVLSSRHAEDITALGMLPASGAPMGDGGSGGSGTILSADMLVSALVQEDGDGRMPLGLLLKKSASLADLINNSLQNGFVAAST